MATWKAPEEYAEWVNWLAAGVHGRNRWRLSVVLLGMLFGGGRRTVTSWLRGAAVDANFSGYYYFIAALGRKTTPVATRLLTLLLKHLPIGDRALLVLDDTPTKRYGRWWNCGPGRNTSERSAIAELLPGTTPSTALHTPTGAKPCGEPASNKNIRPSCPATRSREKSLPLSNASESWPPNQIAFQKVQ